MRQRRLEGLLAREDVPGRDEDLARDGGLGRIGLAVAGLGVGVEAVPRVGRPPRLLRGFDRCPPQVSGPALEMPPVRELCPDCLIVGVRPE